MRHSKHNLILLILLCITNFFYSQNFKIYYLMKYKEDSLSNEVLQKNMVLLTSKNAAKFISSEQFASDSLAIEDIKNGKRYTVNFDYEFMARVDTQNLNAKKYKFVARDLYEVTLPLDKFDWKIENETKKIGEYSCQKATLIYCGRYWEAWFTKEIPLNFGPYIFRGLPGLILNLKDKKDNFEFIFSGIKKSEADIDYLSTKPLAVSSVQLEKVIRDYYNDPFREMKSSSAEVIHEDENGNPIKPDYNQWTKDEQQSMREKNNPIELCTAIKFSK